MTTESADAPHSAPFLPRPAATRPTAVRVHPPRRPGRDTPLPPGPGRAVRNRTTAPLLAADCLATTGAAFLVHDPAPVPALLGPVVLCLLVLNSHAGLYRPGLAPTALGDLPALLGRAVVCWCATAAALAAVHPGRSLDPAALLCAPAVHAVLACGGRAAVYRARRAAARRRPRSTLIVGVDLAARQLAAALHAHPEYGLRPVGLVALGAVVPGAPGGRPPEPGGELPLPRLTSPQDIMRAVVQNTVRDAVFTRPPEADPQTAALLRRFVDQGSAIWLAGAAAGYDGRSPGPGGEHLWGFACRRLDTAAPRHGGRGKRTSDVVLAAVLLLAAAPVLVGCALAVRLSDGPGVIFRQERIGRHGRAFMLLKFRTLLPRDEHESATRWSVADDRRMSRVGRLLRRTSLDELPQLWNVLRGDMSLVGPRPERPYFVQQFTQSYPDYGARHRMPAGITGLAQVHGLRGDTSIEDRARFDNRYIDSWSLWQDAQIMLRTVGSLFRMEGR
ncbi:exopolysaccharide biosynthesis polyprenyl glycosylphosphotransferase [Streptomyces sp. NPDC050636]|uniref:exopolysaccharide biosynthesis polyprenyl glycosylphosphotransferase n=1 Tax=Streptomyces sp. NPDC050636 TaxID=3154510 RepID=UPI0034477775